MLEHTSYDDFMRGLYKSRVLQQKQKSPDQNPHLAAFDNMMNQVFKDDDSGTKSKAQVTYDLSDSATTSRQDRFTKALEN